VLFFFCGSRLVDALLALRVAFRVTLTVQLCRPIIVMIGQDCPPQKGNFEQIEEPKEE
jgi:hypothetical protein